MHLRGRLPRLLLVIMGTSFLVNIAFNIYRSVFSNFAAQELMVDAGRYGWLEGIREVPGLLTILMFALAARIGDARMYSLSIGLTGVGIWMYATSHTYADLIVATIVQSTGFHLWSVVQDSMVIKAVDPTDRARQLGRVNSIAAAATLLGMGFVTISGQWLGIRSYFIVAGLVGLLAAVVSMLVSQSHKETQLVRFVVRWKYRSYYILTLLQGARRHIVSTFAAFALVKLHGASVQTMALLLAAHSFLAIWTRPMIGRIIDRVGEQRALSINYGAVATVFLGYAFVPQAWVAYTLFIVDNVLTGFDIAVSTHAGRIIPREELSSSLATGTTINHIFGVLVPVAGGFLWTWFGPQVPFLMGVGIVLAAMAYSWNLDDRLAAAQKSA
ncbi:MAG TPA: MFS transporter [Symbiobacteriaceae bacterium]|nr:MFS transporter [Symbiobacteriaceae bacterium]